MRLGVTVGLSADGCLGSFRASGHAGGAREGVSIPCAAVTTLLRTAARTLSAFDCLVLLGEADSPGEMRLEIAPDGRADPRWLQGVTDFLLRGLSDLEAEYPGEIAVHIR